MRKPCGRYGRCTGHDFVGGKMWLWKVGSSDDGARPGSLDRSVVGNAPLGMGSVVEFGAVVVVAM